MTYQLRGGLAFCIVNARPVFLDVGRDRYFMTKGSLEAAFNEFVAGGDPSRESLDRLMRAGLLESAAGSRQVPAAPDILSPRRSVIEEERPELSAGLAATANAACCLMRSRRRLRRDGFARTINRLRTRRPCADEKRHTFIEKHAAEFNSARSLFPAPPNCLPDSLALLDYLYAKGAAATLVIGVRLEPYGAHAWVQARDVLLNEAADYAASFTPILTV